jgi:predicted O-methyltransferase YrrM
LCVAQALPKDGKIIAMDVSKEFTDIAQEQWKKSGVQDKINLILAPATETMEKLIKDSQNGTFDFAFIE